MGYRHFGFGSVFKISCIKNKLYVKTNVQEIVMDTTLDIEFENDITFLDCPEILFTAIKNNILIVGRYDGTITGYDISNDNLIVKLKKFTLPKPLHVAPGCAVKDRHNCIGHIDISNMKVIYVSNSYMEYILNEPLKDFPSIPESLADNVITTDFITIVTKDGRLDINEAGRWVVQDNPEFLDSRKLF